MGSQELVSYLARKMKVKSCTFHSVNTTPATMCLNLHHLPVPVKEPGVDGIMLSTFYSSRIHPFFIHVLEKPILQ